MWLGASLWMSLTISLLICASSAYSSSFADFGPSSSAAHSHKKTRDTSPWSSSSLGADRTGYLDDASHTQRDLSEEFLDLDSWPEKNSGTMSRQLFGDKNAVSSESLRSSEGEEEVVNTKRDSHSLSIVNPLDVLRQRLMLEMARRRMKENQDQIRENAVILKNLGKRAARENSTDQDAVESRTNQNYLRRIYASNSKNFDV